jgi:hypothetical protein
MLDVAQSFLDLLYCCLIAGVLAHVVTELDGGPSAGAGDLDDDVERLRLLAVGLAVEVI